MSHPTGFNTTIFAYGQTGSGKTYSMQGVGGVGGEGAGIIPRMNEELFGRCVVGIARLSKAVVRASWGGVSFRSHDSKSSFAPVVVLGNGASVVSPSVLLLIVGGSRGAVPIAAVWEELLRAEALSPKNFAVLTIEKIAAEQNQQAQIPQIATKERSRTRANKPANLLHCTPQGFAREGGRQQQDVSRHVLLLRDIQ